MKTVKSLDSNGNRVSDDIDIVCIADRLAVVDTLERVEVLRDRALRLVQDVAEEADESGYVYEQLADVASLLDSAIYDGLDVAMRILEEALETP